MIPPSDDVSDVREKYGLCERMSEHQGKLEALKQRNYDGERGIILSSLERVAKYFLAKLARGDNVFDNNSKYVEEFCTLIELCLNHGVKEKFGFWRVLENYQRKMDNSKSNQSAIDIVRNHFNLPNNSAKLRAWIRVALTKKLLVVEVKRSIEVVKNIENVYDGWSITRNDTFSCWLTVIDALGRIDFNLVVKEYLLNTSGRPISWEKIFDSGSLHLDRIVGYLNLNDLDTFHENLMNTASEDLNKTILRSVGFLEDENVRLRKSILMQLNEKSKLEESVDSLNKALSSAKSYINDLEEEVQRLTKIKYELEEKF